MEENNKMNKKLCILMLGMLTASILFISMPNVKAQPMPDLYVPSHLLNHGPMDDWHFLTGWVKNGGDSAADPTFTTKYGITGYTEGYSWIIYTKTHSVGIPSGWTVTAGLKPFYLSNPEDQKYFCTIITDYGNNVVESNENNQYRATEPFWC